MVEELISGGKKERETIRNPRILYTIIIQMQVAVTISSVLSEMNYSLL